MAAPTAMLELVVSEKSLKPPPSPTPAPVVASAPSRFKGMLGRADSLRKATLPTPAVQPQPTVPEVVEKVVPPSSPTPPVVASVTPTSSPQLQSTQPTPPAGATESSTSPPRLEHPLDQGTPAQLGATIVPEPGLIANNNESVNGTTSQNESPDQRQSSDGGDHPQPLELQVPPPSVTVDVPKSPPPPPTPEKDRGYGAENGNVTGQTEETS